MNIKSVLKAIKDNLFPPHEMEGPAYRTYGDPSENEIFLPVGTQAAAFHTNIDAMKVIDGVKRDYDFAMEHTNGQAHPKSHRFFKGKDGEVMLETVHEIDCYANGHPITCPITITAPGAPYMNNDPQILEREIQRRSTSAFKVAGQEQEKLDAYIKAEGKEPPQGIVAVNMAISIAKREGIDIADNQAIIKRIKKPEHAL